METLPVLGQLALEPAHIPARLYAHVAARRQTGIKLVHLLALSMLQPLLHYLAALLVHRGHLLTNPMKITAYNPRDWLLSPERLGL